MDDAVSPDPGGAADAPPPPQRSGDREMPFVEHLAEMRFRIMWALAAWAVCSLAAWFAAPQMVGLLRRLIGNTELVFLRPTEAFFVFFKVALVGGFFLALPVILYQVAAFVAPGLEPGEKKWLRLIGPMAFLLFVAGAVFAYFVLLPVTLSFFLSFQTENLKAMISLSEFIGFVVFLMVVCGLVFETPIVMILLAMVGVVNSSLLRRGRRWAILIMFIIAAIITPTPDAFTQTMVALPMIVLYEVSIVIIRLMRR